jgi:outer membrane immunogenic protein
LLAGVALSALIAGPAMAADLARPVYRRPVVVAAPVYSWTGWYAGINAGYGSDNRDVTFNGDPVDFGFAIATGLAAGRLSPSATGALGGIQAGYNYQMGSGVIGVEIDYDFANIRGSSTFNALVAPFQNTAERKITSLGTLRARAGFLPWSPLLLYVTGGLAYGNTRLTITEAFLGNCLAGAGCETASSSGTAAGWTAGGGAEWMFAPRWSLKAEYLYVDLGNRSATLSAPPPILLPGNFYTGSTSFRENIVRVGLNYKFGYAAAPAVYK